MEENATKQAEKIRPGKGGVVPPKDKQFGQPNGNPRHNGAWKKEETARWKFEQLIKMADAELEKIESNKDLARFERSTARLLLWTRDLPKDRQLDAWKLIEGITNQIYGAPKQKVEADLSGEIKTVEVSIRDYTISQLMSGKGDKDGTRN